MATTKPKLVAINTDRKVTSGLVGYVVIADITQGDGGRTLVLERPETNPSAQTARKPRRKAATPQTASNAQETASQEVTK